MSAGVKDMGEKAIWERDKKVFAGR
jgi:hypothetical protein